MTPRRAILLLLAAYVAGIASLTSLPWFDLPMHLTRITIIGRLLFAPTAFYVRHYSFHWMFTPYLLWDALAAITSRFLPVVANGVVWSVLTFLVVVAGGWYLARVRLGRNDQVAVVVLLSVLIASGWFFCMGFFADQISFGISLLALGVGHRLRARPAGPIYILYVLLVVACYLGHLAGFLGLCVASAAAAVAGVAAHRRSLLREAALLAPPLLLGVWHVVSRASAANGLAGGWIWGGIGRKLLSLASPWLRFSVAWDSPLLLGLALTFALLAIRALPALKTISRRAVLTDDLFLSALCMAGAYVVLPQIALGVWEVDVRTLPYTVYFACAWLVSLQPRPKGAPLKVGRFDLPAGVLLATCWVSLAVLLIRFEPSVQDIHAYWQLLQRIPPRQVVLPVATQPHMGRVSPTAHQGCLYAAFREGAVPYIAPSTTAFFTEREPIAAPDSDWYVRHLPAHWGSPKLACDFLVVSKPFDPSRLPLAGAPILAENQVAVVFDLRALVHGAGRLPDASGDGTHALR